LGGGGKGDRRKRRETLDMDPKKDVFIRLIVRLRGTGPSGEGSKKSSLSNLLRGRGNVKCQTNKSTPP